MNSKKMVSRFWSCMFMLVCAAGLLWQLTSVIDLYFQYRVTTSTFIFRPEAVNPLGVTLCVNWRTVFDYKRANRDLNRNITKDSYGYANIYWHNMEVPYVFKYTPRTDEVLDKFNYKTKNKSHPMHYAANISDHVDVQKFFVRKFVCYTIVVKGDEPLYSREIAVTNNYEYEVKRFTFHRQLENANEIKIILGPIDHLPYKGLGSTPAIDRRLISSSATDLNRFRSRHLTISATSMPSPYDTDCRDFKKDGFHDRYHCIDDCITSQVRINLKNKVCALSPILEPREAKIFMWGDDPIFQKIEHYCEFSRCAKRECHDTDIVTLTDASLDLIPNRQFIWRHEVTFQISIEIRSIPALPFVEFLIYILGSISTWTGLSVLGCNPLALQKHVAKTFTLHSQAKDTNTQWTDSQRKVAINHIQQPKRDRMPYYTASKMPQYLPQRLNSDVFTHN